MVPKKKNDRPRTGELREVNENAKAAATTIVENKRMGRPPKYHPHFVHMINALAEGLVSSTNAQLGIMFGVDDATIDGWLKQHPDFSSAVMRARTLADMDVEKALRLRALGYSHRDTKVFCAPRTGEIVTHDVIAHYPPDTKAIQFWLGNRHPDRWKMRQDESNVPPPADAAADLRAAIAEMDAKSSQGGSK